MNKNKIIYAIIALLAIAFLSVLIYRLKYLPANESEVSVEVLPPIPSIITTLSGQIKSIDVVSGKIILTVQKPLAGDYEIATDHDTAVATFLTPGKLTSGKVSDLKSLKVGDYLEVELREPLIGLKGSAKFIQPIRL